MITPLDIQTKSFSNAAMGYKKAEVDAFFEELLRDYEALYKSSNESNAKIKELTKLVDSYKGMEETMKNTLVVAQSSAEQLTASAHKEDFLPKLRHCEHLFSGKQTSRQYIQIRK